jgi:hypothetical protein
MIWLAMFEVFDVFMAISVAALALAQATQVGGCVCLGA